MSRLGGRVALVTGAAGAGIGRATARRLLVDGAAVAVTDSHEQRTAEVTAMLAAELGPGATVLGLPLDVADRDATDQVLEEVRGRLGPIDVLVNNAALNVLAEAHAMDPADWDRTLAVDLSGPWYLIRGVMPGMVALGRGAIVNVTSVAAYLGSGREGPYAAAKAALQSLTRTIAAEGGPHGIRCNAVAPGIVRSKFVETHLERLGPALERAPLRRIGEPDEVAAVIAFLVSDEASYITGETITVSGGWYMRP